MCSYYVANASIDYKIVLTSVRTLLWASATLKPLTTAGQNDTIYSITQING